MKKLIVILLLLISSNIYSTVEYSVLTGRNCIECHKDKDGGELTVYGEEYLVLLKTDESFEPISDNIKTVRTLFGLLHFLTAFIWFGAILYIHLILKPKYVAHGIPKGELRIGWISMLIMLFTGIYLTYQKFPHFHLLFESEIGILLVIKIALFLFMVLTIFIVTFYIAPKLNPQSKKHSNKTEGKFSSEELAYFDGKDGKPAYVAYKGDVYEVTHSVFWHAGQHVLKHSAGMDLTSSMAIAPHDDNVLNGFIKKGILIKNKKIKKKPVIKFFYTLAYAVLVCIFLITVILSLWKWWY